MSNAPRIDGVETENLVAIFPGASQKISVTAAAAASTAMGAETTVVRLFSTEDCYIKIAVTPVATSSDLFLPGGIVEYFAIGAGEKISAVRSSADGTLYITEAK